jgi:hypothetical protein
VPDAHGRFKGIAVPELPWLTTQGGRRHVAPPAIPSVQEDERPQVGLSNRDKTPKLP